MITTHNFILAKTVISMTECELLKGCPFFNEKMEDMPQGTEMYKTEYCNGDNSRCARFMVFEALGKPSVPNNLFPFQVTKAKSLIAKHQS